MMNIFTESSLKFTDEICEIDFTHSIVERLVESSFGFDESWDEIVSVIDRLTHVPALTFGSQSSQQKNLSFFVSLETASLITKQVMT